MEEPEAAHDQPVKVALLLPLSGSLASLGKAMSDAAQMAMFDLADRRFELMPIDDKGTANGSADAAEQAIANGARLILGPLLAPSVRAVAPLDCRRRHSGHRFLQRPEGELPRRSYHRLHPGSRGRRE